MSDAPRVAPAQIAPCFLDRAATLDEGRVDRRRRRIARWIDG